MSRGLNRNFNRLLKNIFKGAATTIIRKMKQTVFGHGENPIPLETCRTMYGRLQTLAEQNELEMALE